MHDDDDPATVVRTYIENPSEYWSEKRCENVERTGMWWLPTIVDSTAHTARNRAIITT